MARGDIAIELRRLLSRVERPAKPPPHFWQVVKSSNRNGQTYVVSPMCLTCEKAKTHLEKAGVQENFQYALNEYAVQDDELKLIESQAL